MGRPWMTILGGIFEVIGFAVIVWQLVRVQRQEFGTPQFVHRLRARVRKLLGKPPITVSAGASMLARFNIEGRGTVRKAMGPDVEDRLAALEHNVAAIESDFSERVGALKSQLGEVSQGLNVTRSEIQQREREREQQRKAELRSSIKYEALGVAFFLSGTVLSVIGSV
jgi:hypothetical protein